MASSGEKIIFIVVLLIIGYFAFFGIMPMFFLRGHMPMEGHFLGIPRMFPLAALPILLLTLVWIFVVVWVYRDAERRGMSGVLWALLVLVGNFIGLLIYLIVRNDELPGQLAIAVTESCSSCGKTVPQKFAFCPHCGNRMKAVCPSCDEPVSSGWKVCPYCGNKLAENE